MIEVPYTVKTALRNGDMLKKYRIVVLEADVPISAILTPPFTYTAPKDDTYTFFNGETGYGFNSVQVGKADGFFINIPTSFPPMGGSNYDTTTQVTIDLEAGDVVEIDATSDVTYVNVTSATPDTQASFTIDNDNLVKESVSIDERMCSGDTLKFGLCEGSSLEFQYFGYPNIRGRRVQVFIDVQYTDTDKSVKWYTIPMGYFTVEQCSTQASTGIIKALAYNKLKSEYLDEKKNDEILEEFSNSDEVYVYDILNLMLGDYSIFKEERTIVEPRDSNRNTGNSYMQGTYKYTSQTGDQGPLGPYAVSGSSTGAVYMRWHGHVDKYEMRTVEYPIQIRTSVDFETIDKNFLSVLTSATKKMSINITADEMLNRIINSKGSSGDADGFDYFPFYFMVVFNDMVSSTAYRRMIFGDTLYKYGLADGTFADLNKLTFENVRQIVFRQPMSIGIYQSGYIPDIDMPFYGDDKTYSYSDGTNSHTATYVTPKMPDGSNILYPGSVSGDLSDYIEVSYITNLSSADLVKVKPSEMADVTLRDLQSAVYETAAEYGQIDRVTDLFSGVSLGHERLYPAESLYPSNALYPGGKAARVAKSNYQKLWTDSVGAQTFRYLIITYKGIETDENGNESEKDFTLQRTVNPDGTTDYNMSDNWIFRNLIWTAEDVAVYADAMVEKMKPISWFPFEMWAPGLPFLETGDELEITTKDGTYTSYVLQRTLSGIQNLQDTIINGQLDIF